MINLHGDRYYYLKVTLIMTLTCGIKSQHQYPWRIWWRKSA